MTLKSKQSVLLLVIFSILSLTPFTAFAQEEPQDAPTYEWPDDFPAEAFIGIVEDAMHIDANAETVEHWQTVNHPDAPIGWTIYAFDPSLTLSEIGVAQSSSKHIEFTVEGGETCSYAGFLFEGNEATIVVVLLPASYVLESDLYCGFANNALQEYSFIRWHDNFVVD